MAAQVYLVTKANADKPSLTIIDDIHAALINSDDGGSDAVKIAELEAVIQANGHPIPSGYFDTVQLIGPPTAGVMTTDEDVILILRRTKTEVIA